MKLIIATQNQGKIEGAKKAFERFFEDIEIVGISAESEVGEQPVNIETYLGAKNRVKNLKKHCLQNGIKADLFLAVESGIANVLGEWMITNIAVIEDSSNKFSSFGTSPSFPVPHKLVNEIIHTDLSRVMNKVFDEDNDRRNHGGGIQLLTHSEVSRIDLTELAFIMALTKLINGEKWR